MHSKQQWVCNLTGALVSSTPNKELSFQGYKLQSLSLTSSETYYYGIPIVANSLQSQSCHIVHNTSQLLNKKNERSKLVNSQGSKGSILKEKRLFTKFNKNKQTNPITNKQKTSKKKTPPKLSQNYFQHLRQKMLFFIFIFLGNKENQTDFSISKLESLPTRCNFLCPPLKQIYPWNRTLQTFHCLHKHK